MARAAILAAALWLTAGCGATSVRLTAAPTVDARAQPGFEAALAIGIGMPVDYSPGRSHQFLQEHTALGGGIDGPTRAGMFTLTQSIDYIRWLEPRADFRAGTHFAFHDVHLAGDARLQRYGFGTHVGLLPHVWADDTTWLVRHLCVGPELRADALRGPDGWTGRFSLPLAIELNFLAAGD